jgi:hypothetical protein
MGGNHSAINRQTSITDVVTDILVNSMQSAVNVVEYKQGISLKCTELNKAIAEYAKECFERWVDLGSANVLLMCDGANDFKCEINQVTMTQSVNVSIDNEQRNLVKINVKNAIKTKLENRLRQESGVLQFGNKTKLDIESLVTLTTKIFSDNIQEIYSSIKGKQTINAGGASVTFATMMQTNDSVFKFLEENRSYIDIANTVRSDISSDLSQQNSVLSTIWTIVIAVITVVVSLVLLIVLIRVIMKKRRLKISL